MRFKIVAVGKIKESYFREAIAEYVKRLGRFCKVQVVEVEECFSRSTQPSEAARVKTAEGQAILPLLEGYVAAMDIDGTLVDSEQFSRMISAQKQQHSVFTFVIGGSNGLSDEVKQRADVRLSFGRVTMPHMLFRVVLCEQLYRACCIENNVTYHK